MLDSFETTVRHDFVWPYPKPMMAIPQAPPLVTKPPGFSLDRPQAGSCSCDVHQPDVKIHRYQCLADRERRQFCQLMATRETMKHLANWIIEDKCGNSDEIMESLCQIDYKKRGFPRVEYRPLMTAMDSPVGTPVKPQKLGLGKGLRDPTSFRFMPSQKPSVAPPKDITFSVTPHTVLVSSTTYPGYSEYESSISRTGKSIMLNQLQYREPLPSSRRRFGDPHC